MDPLEAHRHFFANLVTASAGVAATDRRLNSAFAAAPRELFVGRGWWLSTSTEPLGA